MKTNWWVIFAVVERGKADVLVKAARGAGASGATILMGRGTATTDFLKLFRIRVSAVKEIVFILADDATKPAILQAITDAGNLEAPGTGIAFTLPIGDVVGLGYRVPAAKAEPELPAGPATPPPKARDSTRGKK